MSTLKTTTELPEFVYSAISGKDVPETKWSNAAPPPAIGERVYVTMNSLGTAVVESYQVLHGWLGLNVRFTNPPDWFVNQNKRNHRDNTGLVFGAEIA